MPSTLRIHITGASGSGTTTLGRELARTLDCAHFDADNYFWLPTDPPFEKKRERTERNAMLLNDLHANDRWVLSGSVSTWDDDIYACFDLVVFLLIPAEIRLARLA